MPQPLSQKSRMVQQQAHPNVRDMYQLESVNMSISAFRRNDVCGLRLSIPVMIIKLRQRERLRSAESILVAVRP